MNNNKFEYTFSGTLTKNEANQYELHKKDKSVNISNVLNTIYYSVDYHSLNITIMCGKKILFSEEGYLDFIKPAPKKYALGVNGANLEEALENAVGKSIDITIVATALEGTDEYGSSQT